MIRDSEGRGFAVRVLPIWGLILCLVAGCASGVGRPGHAPGGGSATRPAPGPDQHARNPDNVPVNVFVILDNTLNNGNRTQLVVVLERRVEERDGPQKVYVKSTYFPITGPGTASDVWAMNMSPDGDHMIVAGYQVATIDVQVNSAFTPTTGSGSMVIEACTLEPDGTCPIGKAKAVVASINP